MKLLKILLSIIGIILLLVILFFGFLWITEYRPDDVETLEIKGSSSEKIKLDTEYKALNWNIGYAGLDKDTDFFMDGGEMVHPISRDHVENALEGIFATIERENADIDFIQEIDRSSTRTYKINQVDLMDQRLGGNSVFANNFKVAYVPFPLPPLGKMDSGIYTNTHFQIESSQRYQQPNPFTWPVSMANLKRGFSSSFLPIEGSDKFLVAINVHLDAYDEGNAGKIAQTKQIMEFIDKEYSKGNYVIVAGDLNQELRDGEVGSSPEGVWEPDKFDKDLIPDNFNLFYDPNVTTTRVNDKPYNPETAYEYVIDGYIVSNNIEVTYVTGLDEEYVHADHNPVELGFKLIP